MISPRPGMKTRMSPGGVLVDDALDFFGALGVEGALVGVGKVADFDGDSFALRR